MRDTINAVVATAIGAFVGTIISLQFTYIWWVGMLVGGLVAYLAYDYKAVGKAVKEVWEAMTGWRPNRRRWLLLGVHCKYMSKLMGAAIIALYSVALPLYAILILVYSTNVTAYEKLISAIPWFVAGSVGLTIYFVGGVFSLLYLVSKSPVSCIKDIRDHIGITMHFPKRLYMEWIPTAIKTTPRILMLAVRFIVSVYKKIHCEQRLMCGLDAAIAVGVGYFTQSAWIGLVTGGVLVALNIEIVSKRIMKLIPVRTK